MLYGLQLGVRAYPFRGRIQGAIPGAWRAFSNHCCKTPCSGQEKARQWWAGLQLNEVLGRTGVPEWTNGSGGFAARLRLPWFEALPKKW